MSIREGSRSASIVDDEKQLRVSPLHTQIQNGRYIQTRISRLNVRSGSIAQYLAPHRCIVIWISENHSRQFKHHFISPASVFYLKSPPNHRVRLICGFLHQHCCPDRTLESFDIRVYPARLSKDQA